ncbi:unnamed protein product [Parnassius mnemosyne]|uniref:Integrase catalytic domain-containing protein n=3 Tax=Parnassius mnemosyne TaxID=213953 RepID=A0AAV1KMW6_9NEOP
MSDKLQIKRQTLIFKKEYLFAKLQKVFDIARSQINDPTQIQNFLADYSELESVRSKFEETVLNIIEIDISLKPETRLSTRELDTFDELYKACRLQYLRLKPDEQASLSRKDRSDVRPSLPKLRLFEFDGDIEKWTTFYDTFVSLVHNRDFDEIDKFHYLLSCVKGSALNIVKKLPITAANYTVVWQSLCNKYQDDRILVGRYIDKMINFTPLNKDTTANLTLFIETFDHSFKAIEALKIKNLHDYLFCHLALRGLDAHTRRLFEENREQNSLPSFSELISFVNKQVKVLEHSSNSTMSLQSRNKSICNNYKGNNNNHYKSYSKTVLNTNVSNYNKNKKIICAHCNQNHMIYRCDQFRKLTVDKRIDRVNTLKLCHNCLKGNHDTSTCKSEMSCGVCASLHHYLLHREPVSDTLVPTSTRPLCSDSQVQQALVSSQAMSDSERYTIDTLHSNNVHSGYGVVLGTARVLVIDSSGQLQYCRAVIDSGAQSSFITTECAQRLGLPRKKCSFNIYGLGGEAVKNHGMITCTLRSLHTDLPSFTLNMVVVTKVSADMPNVRFHSDVINKYKNFNLADPLFYKRSRIDILLGNDIVSELIKDKPYIISSDIPSVIDTAFGFVVSGKLYSNDKDNLKNYNLSVSFDEQESLDQTLRKFWEIEELPSKPSINPLEQLAEDIFVARYSRTEDGTYSVPLPFIPDPPPLGASRAAAERRLLFTERKLNRSPVLRQAYSEFMCEYENLGHMELYSGDTPSKYVIPHHSILKPSSSTTPLRVVFDASAKTSTNVSLNDILLTGPNLYRDIGAIILNFRLFEYCLICDVCKMYRAIKLNQSDRCYQHILYRHSPNDAIDVYELKTVTYGLSCSPFLAIRTLLQLAYDEKERFPLAAKVVREGVYMDDILYSCSSLSQISRLQDELLEMFNSGGFILKRWASNSAKVLQRVPLENRECPVTFMKDGNEYSVKVLGLKWFPLTDCFYFTVDKTDKVTTKRSVLKLLASIYDPVGFISPCIFIAKEIMQDLWKLGIGWDEQLPTDVTKRWLNYVDDLPRLTAIKIDRHMLLPEQTECELVAFCDASSRGYASCVYVISRNDRGQTKVRLVTAKSKVAPVKPLTIPRLELMASVLLSKLIRYVRDILTRVKITRITALTDSTIVLTWLQTEAYKLKPFVSNRVTQVCEVLPPHCWRHVSSECNMADICSRGASPSQLVECSEQWLKGPSWLYDDYSQWPVRTFINQHESNTPEMKSNHTLGSFNLITNENNSIEETKLEFCDRIFSNFSSYYKLQRTFARILRWFRLKSGHSKQSILTTNELNTAQDVLIKLVQSAYFANEINRLSMGTKYVPSLRKLSPFIDERGYLRVGGRINYSALPYNAKHPRLIPKNSRFTFLLIEYLHKKYLHVGPRTLQNIINQNFWILASRRIIRSVLSKCKICFKHNPVLLQPEMAPLPAARLIPCNVFEHVGVDLGGPFFTKESLRRNARVERSYLALFICYSTKAVHLEVLSSLSSDCFLACLDRFVARRGVCSFLYSDCGTNFIAASKHLTEVQRFMLEQKNNILEGCSKRQIIWRFNPPGAPHMGGLWEAGIKSAKYLLTRAVGEKSLTFEELTTVFCKVEAILNSRPLCPLPASDNPDEFNVLTAGHFLIGKGLTAVPEYNVEDITINRLSRWQYIQNCSQMFWRRWSHEYLNTLQQKAKWHSDRSNIKIGDLVIIKTDNVPPCDWPLGRIEALHPGPDGIVRCVTLRTQKSTLQRPVNKLSPLPYSN